MKILMKDTVVETRVSKPEEVSHPVHSSGAEVLPKALGENREGVHAQYQLAKDETYTVPKDIGDHLIELGLAEKA